jgi:hypothetical protein
VVSYAVDHPNQAEDAVLFLENPFAKSGYLQVGSENFVGRSHSFTMNWPGGAQQGCKAQRVLGSGLVLV